MVSGMPRASNNPHSDDDGFLKSSLCVGYDCTLTTPQPHAETLNQKVVERQNPGGNSKPQTQLNQIQLGGPLGTDSNSRRGRSEVVSKVSCYTLKATIHCHIYIYIYIYTYVCIYVHGNLLLTYFTILYYYYTLSAAWVPALQMIFWLRGSN